MNIAKRFVYEMASTSSNKLLLDEDDIECELYRDSDSVCISDSDSDLYVNDVNSGSESSNSDNISVVNNTLFVQSQHGDGDAGPNVNIPKFTGNVPSPDKLQFTGQTGLNILIPDNFCELDYFELIFSQDLLQHIVTETNRYANDYIASADLAVNSRVKKWKDMTIEELNVFFALVILMGYTKRPTIQSYWTTDELFVIPAFSKILSVNRFLLISKFLHFSDNSQAVPGNKLNKLQTVIDHLKLKFKTLYSPGEHLAADESLMLWKGRLHWKQFIKDKAAKWGIKSYELCESDGIARGYLVDFNVYTGKSDVPHAIPVTQKAILDLVDNDGLRHCGRKLYMDRFYSSPELYIKLKKLGFNSCGTVQAGRKHMPKDIKTLRLKKGDVVTRTCDDLMVLRWKDKRDVYMLSNFHGDSMAASGKIDHKTKEPVVKPVVVLDYNKKMGGVDVCDQMVDTYQCMRKTIKWYHKLFLHLFDISSFQAYKLKCIHENSVSQTQLIFKKNLARQLLHKYKGMTFIQPSPRQPPPRKRKLVQVDKPVHVPTHIPPTAKRSKPTRVCRICPGRRETRFECRDCGNVPLHMDECFRKFHEPQQ